MKVLAIDPGNEKSAIIIWDSSLGDKGKVLYKNHLSNEELILVLDELFSEYHDIERIGIEYPSSYGMGVGQTVFDTCTFVGILCFYFKLCWGKSIELVFRRTVKLHHTRRTTSKDGEVNQSVQNKYGVDSTKKVSNPVFADSLGYPYMKGDIWAAFAVATFLTEPKYYILEERDLDGENNKISKSLTKVIKTLSQ